ncbi:hypothetical protein ACVFYP_17505 [Roseomonas sp. F4]
MSSTHLTSLSPAAQTPRRSDAALFCDPAPRLGISWLDDPAPRVTARHQSTDGLIQAVVGIVAIAAERARLVGDLPALRDALERALGQTLVETEAADPREQGLPLPMPIRDADRGNEVERLGTLMRRQLRG